MFDLASKLVWHGGDDVYEAGKRDVATLYEYWVFFKLLDLFSSFFELEPTSIDELIEPTNDGLGLKLKSGKPVSLNGTYKMSGRNMNIRFSYNRTFSKAKKYPDEGSWTVNMRPDYTLSMWPSDFEDKEAEKQEVIVHIHFDAKYKIENLKALFDTENDMDSELTEQKSGVYKRADLLKMHAYKDAIRRTVGAYVIYPGSNGDLTNQNFKGFHEVLPGLGAFAVNPSKDGNNMEAIEKFITDVTNRFISKSSQYEKMSYSTYDTNQNYDEDAFILRDSIPEKYGTKRSQPPANIFVMIGYYRSENENWIKSEKQYNIRFEDNLDANLLNAKYLLLYHGDEITGDLWKITEKDPVIRTKQELKNNGYNNPRKDEYYVYDIEEVNEVELKDLKWNLSEMKKYNNNSNNNYKPFAISLLELMKVKI